MLHGESGWSIISDSTRKERFLAADGEVFLEKLKTLRLGSWNYKNQGANPKRFYGPMAQEIFAAFGKDTYGTIGNDTTLNATNMDGLLFIFSQALMQRTQKLKEENQHIRQRFEAENQTLKMLIRQIDERLISLEANNEVNLNKQLAR